jgi:hypothetical protein
MPLRDHFHPPVNKRRSWEGFHGAWPTMIVAALARRMPPGYVAEPRVHLGAYYEIDVASFEEMTPSSLTLEASAAEVGIATAAWAPPRPTLVVVSDLPDQYEYEVRVYDTTDERRLVAAVEIVSPANKDRPEHRRVFVAKCATLLRQGVCVAIVDLVTTRSFNLYADLLDLIGQTDPSLAPEPPSLYGAVCRARREGDVPQLEMWAHPLVIGQQLPTLPLWLSDNLAIPLELEASYEETCRILRIE